MNGPSSGAVVVFVLATPTLANQWVGVYSHLNAGIHPAGEEPRDY